MAQEQSFKLSVAHILQVAIGVLATTVVGGYFFYRNESSFYDELVLVAQLTALGLVYGMLTKNLIAPLKEIFSIADKIRKGDFSQRFKHDQNSYYAVLTFSYNQLLEKIKNATEFIKGIEEGQLDAEYQLVEGEEIGKDTLSGSLLSMRDQMKVIEEETKERNWSTQGLAKFVEILRANDENIKQLGDKIISNLVQYLNANQGGLFILTEERGKPALELISCYAYDRKKYVERVIEPGQGLVGQTYLEKETIYITDVPRNYVNITSGLGEATPSSLILVPLKINNQVYGILEMASFHKFEKYQIEFLEKLGESIASTISTAKTAERTRKLLRESQEQAEEMRAQEEEMRQNMEELEATQEEMRRVSKELEVQQDKLQNALKIAKMANWEIDLDRNEFHLNDNFYGLLGTNALSEGGFKVKVDQIVSKYFYVDAAKVKQAIQNVIAAANASHEESVTHKAVTKNGKEVYLNVVLKANVSSFGQVTGLFGICRDVTHEKVLEEETQMQMEQMRAQEEEMMQSLEELNAIQDHQQNLQDELNEKVKQLEKAKADVERIKELEKHRADEQIAKTKKMLDETVAKYEKREAELLQKFQGKNVN